ncbi:metalloproteinase inhibitor 3 isoform X1 [Hydra vulgaris]|uniref:metalloproteinase inhibitor 3 isoform X1 n=1 Tax=Hydra vulgaris TaxID=6087 RepID=UPI001F5F0FCA|nr:metalloproteinase inhibitor 3-like [Hydra vulgaris]
MIVKRMVLSVSGLILILASFNIKVVLGCMCMPIHPHSAFCKSEYVVKARILSHKIVKVNHTDESLQNLGIPLPHYIVYKILINSVLKNAKPSFRFNLQQIHSLHIPAAESICGIQLEIGKLYLLTGNFDHAKLQMTSCDFHLKWHQLTVDMIEGMSGKYDCSCQVATCMDGYCDIENGCKWKVSWEKSFEDCVYKHLSCERSYRKVCQWVQKSSYKQCLLAEKIFNRIPKVITKN